MIRSRLGFSIILACALAACNAQEESPGQATSDGTQAAPGSAGGDPSVVHHPEPPARPETKRDSIQLEGTYHPITARLVQPEGSLPFSTYIPEDMMYEPASSDEGEGYYFFSNFGGKKNENAFMLVFLLPPGRTTADAQALGRAFVASRAGSRRIANFRLGSHDDRVFYVAYAYPAEFGDGMGPRTAYIRSQWVWLNDGRSLESTLAPRPE
jgi:hypothetical protein